MPSLAVVRSKIDWAEKHRGAINAEVAQYFQNSAGLIVAEVDAGLYGGVRGTYGPGIPESVPLMIGDCLQNLRSALDYLVWELCLAANAEPGKDNAFPVCKSAEAFKDSLKRKRLKGVPQDAIAAIERLQPYHSGAACELHRLAVLDDLTNINKHRRILLTRLEASVLDPVSVSNSYTGFGTGSTRDVNMDEGIVARIEFNEGWVIGQEISLVLHGLVDHVASLTPEFERFFE